MSTDKTAGEADAPRELREAGLRVTGPRVLILSTLRADRGHPTPESLFDALKGEYPSLSLSTVYQTLETFQRAGLCRRVTTRDGRLRVDGTAHDHDHAVCRACGRIYDVERAPATQVRSPDDLPDGLQVIGVRLEYDVLCHGCADAASPAESNT